MIIKTKQDATWNCQEKKENSTMLFDDLVKLDRGNLICIGSRPGMGKTSLALYMALAYAKKSNKTVYIFSLELYAQHIYNRMVGALAEVNMHLD